MSGLFSLIDLEDDSERLPGSRLQRLEVYNWGTFNARVWTFDVNGRNALLTGDIGSGKSTLVDAITTLLLPSQRISYNKAAGAETRERTLKSYVLGHYKSERNETTGSSRPVALRDTRQYSVILAVFGNADFDTAVTLAQVFWTKEGHQGQPDRFYVVAEDDLTVRDAFTDFGSDIISLKRKLRGAGAKVHDSFPEYGKDFRRKLGIDSEQAMELFHQTVSMKAVDNLNDFVRHHMLEPFDTRAQLAALIDHFDDLTRAHDAVVRARTQLELLSPLISELDAYDGYARSIADLTGQRDALPYYFADRKRDLLHDQLAGIDRRLAELVREREVVVAALVRIRQQESDLNIEIAGHGGDRLAALETEIAGLEQQKPARMRRFDRFNLLLEAALLEPMATVEQFASAKQRAAETADRLKATEAEAQNELTERRFELKHVQDESAQINAELRSLQSRRSNVPMKSLELRTRLCGDLGLDEADLPFAGELIQVREDSVEWEGAAERVLHSFALSLLVPNDTYERVARWIDGHHLNARLVYFRVPPTLRPGPEPDRRSSDRLLVDCLDLKPDSVFEPWLEQELNRRADYLCVQSVADFRSARRAVTRAGQVKDKDRHEKDDRSRIDDRRSFVLGWSNQQKIDALLDEANALNQRLHSLIDVTTGLKQRVEQLGLQLSSLAGLGEYESEFELDWQELVRQISGRQGERLSIQESSDLLATLTGQRDGLRSEIVASEQQLAGLQDARGRAGAGREQAAASLAETERLLADTDQVTRARDWFPAVEQQTAQVVGVVSEPRLVDRAEAQLVAALTGQIDQHTSRQNGSAQRALRRMGEFRGRYPQETAEFDDSLGSAGEYRELHHRVAGDDLPRFEAEFKDYLNQNTIRDIAGFFAQLNKQENLIKERVETINESLTTIPYNAGRYIRLVPDRTTNLEVRDFIADLRDCTDNVVGGRQSEQYSEQKFLQVKAIIDRFKGREGVTEVDRSWTRRVTDVRNWFVFSASERWQADDTEYENYTDSGGKSGGQKEKLAYTILAASLAYQFKLDWGAKRSKSFRFVVIDEAFGRGSEESTRYALQLFSRLGLQLLIVTPLQKIHVIEPYVSAVGYVDNLQGNFSRLQGLTVEEYRRLRSERALAQAARAAE